MSTPASLYRVISAAISDFLEHGFDSEERLQYWIGRLDEAARSALVPEHKVQEALRDALTRSFGAALSPNRLAKRHSGLPQFTLARIRPHLRDELDRRILASASLIKLNRESSIQQTLQRFTGWATSIPAGGTRAEDQTEAAKAVRRGIAGLTFVERRVVVDQGHKLVRAIDDILARDGGAIAARWRHVLEGGGYQARPIHERRNGHIFVIRSNWALEKGFMKLAGHQYTDEIEEPGQLVYCRCTYDYLYSPGDLPAEMLTAKGREALQTARRQIREMRRAAE